MDYPTTSCSVRLTNVADFGPMVSPTKLPPRLLARDMWPQGAEVDREHQPPDQDWKNNMDQDLNTWASGRDGQQEPMWNSGRDQAVHSDPHQAWGSAGDSSHRKSDQTWVRGQSRGADRGQVHGQTWNLGRNTEATSQGEDQDRNRGPIWRPGRNLNS